MTVIKSALFGLLLACLWIGWSNRDLVVDAYRHDEAVTEIRFAGIDLDVDRTELDPSPFVTVVAPDNRTRSIAVDYRPYAPVDEDEIEIVMTGGEAVLSGTVTAPGGSTIESSPSPSSSSPSSSSPSSSSSASSRTTRRVSSASGGVVRLERHTADGVGVREVTVGSDGRWSADDLPGGRYRIRAWVPNRYTTDESSVLFLADDEAAVVDFDLFAPGDEVELRFSQAGPIYRGLTGSVGLTAVQSRVDADGLIVTSPVSGVTISADDVSIYSFQNATRQTTGSDGSIVYRLRCQRLGSDTLTVTYSQATSFRPFQRSFDDGDGSGDSGDGGDSGVDDGSGSSRQRTAPTGRRDSFALPPCVPIPPPPTTTTTTTARPGAGSAAGDGNRSGGGSTGAGSTTTPAGGTGESGSANQTDDASTDRSGRNDQAPGSASDEGNG